MAEPNGEQSPDLQAGRWLLKNAITTGGSSEHMLNSAAPDGLPLGSEPVARWIRGESEVPETTTWPC